MYQSAKELAYKAKNRVVSTIDNATGAVVATGASAMVLMQSTMAHADVPPSVTAGITTAVTDVGTIGAAILGVVIAIAAFAWLRRPIH